jgi:hypothetical protein
MSGYGPQEAEQDNKWFGYVPCERRIDTHPLAVIALMAVSAGQGSPHYEFMNEVRRSEWRVELGDRGQLLAGSFGLVRSCLRAALDGRVEGIESAIYDYAANRPTML